MAGYIGARSVTLNTTVATAQDVTATDTTPEVTIINNTHEDSDLGREGKVIFKGQQSGGEESTLAEIEANHHGSSDDEAGQLIIRTNDGSDGTSPTERLRINSVGTMTVTSTDQSVAVMQHSSSSTGALNGGAIFNIKNTDTTNGNQSSIIFRDSADNSTSGIFGFNSDHSDGEGFLKFGTRNSSGTFGERMRVSSDGDVRINTESKLTPQGFDPELSVLGTGNTCVFQNTGGNALVGMQTGGVAGLQNLFIFMNQSGTVSGTIGCSNGNTGTTVSYNTSSDYRLKENVVDASDGITRLKQLKPKSFNWISDDSNTKVDGFLAHEAQTVVPEAVTGTKDELWTWNERDELPDGISVGDNRLDEDGNTVPVIQVIDHSKFVPLLTTALQEAIAKIETLETKVAALESE